MPIMSWRSLLSFSAALVVNHSGIALAQPLPLTHNSLANNLANSPIKILTQTIPDSSPRVNRQKTPQSFLQQLELTTEQQQKIKQVHRRYKRLIHKKRSSLAMLQQQISDMMIGTEPAELIRIKNQQLVSLRQELETLSFESMLATREILTPQQRQKFRELVEAHLAQ